MITFEPTDGGATITTTGVASGIIAAIMLVGFITTVCVIISSVTKLVKWFLSPVEPVDQYCEFCDTIPCHNYLNHKDRDDEQT